MKKTIINVAIALILLGCVMVLYRNKVEEKANEPQLILDPAEVLVSSKDGYNSIGVYMHDNLLIVDAQSEAAFFDGAQFTVETQGDVKAEDIQIIWKTMMGGTEKTENNHFIFAEIKISENGQIIMEQKVNFMEKTFEAFGEYLERKGEK